MSLSRLTQTRRSPRAAATFAAVALFTGAMSSMLTLHWEAEAAAEDGLAGELTLLARIASRELDLSLHKRLVAPEQLNDEEYLRVVAPLRDLIAAAPTVRYIYTTRLHGDEVVFGVDASLPIDADGDGLIDQAALGEVYDDAPDALRRAFLTGQMQVTVKPYTDPWGTFVAAFYPLRDEQDHEKVECVLAVEYDAFAYMSRLNAMDGAAAVGIGVAGLASVLIGLLVYFVQRQRQQADVELIDARRRAEDASRSKSEFLANMSHEIRTPMTSILGYASLVRDDCRDSEFGARHSDELDIIVQNGEHLLSVINDILDISKIEAGHVDLESIEVPLHQLIEDTILLMRPRALDRGLTLDLHIDERVPRYVSSDPTRVRQIIVNLLSNAIKFTRSGGVSVNVDCAACSSDSNGVSTGTTMGACVRVVVRDTGIGMTEQQLARVFRPFEQADSSVTRRYGGSGLGLPISQRLAEMLGGALIAESVPEIGSTFTLTFEVQPCAPPPALPARDGEARGAPPSLEGLRILLVEDSAVNRRLVARILTKEGAAVTEAQDGRAAVEALSCGGRFDAPLCEPPPFDVVLMDMQMPVLDGYSATRILRARGSHVAIIALTAHAMTSDRARCVDAGCDDFATKPIQRAELILACSHAATLSSMRVEA
ncbi:MAG: response regulator [Planctomycetota bacterium]